MKSIDSKKKTLLKLLCQVIYARVRSKKNLSKKKLINLFDN